MTLRRRIGLATLIVVPIVIMAIVLRDFVRAELIGPVLYAYWFIRLIVESIPQIWEWITFILIATVLFVRGFASKPIIWQNRRSEAVDRGRVEDWAGLIRLSRTEEFARWRLAQRLGALTGEILANEERVSQREIWRRLDRGTLRVSQPLRAYLTAQLRSICPSGLRRLRPQSSPLDLDPREVVQFLEDRIRR